MRFLPVVGLLCTLTASVFALDREAFTFTNYDLEVRIEPDQQRLGVRGKIAMRNDSASPQKVVVLQISSSLNWSSIRLEGKPALFVAQRYTSDIDHTGALSEAIVTLPEQLPPKRTLELEIGYEGVIALEGTRLTRIGVPEAEAKHTDWDQIGNPFTAVRGIGYVTWYPVATEAASLSEGNSVFDTVERWKVKEGESQFRVQATLTGEGRRSFVRCNGQSGSLKQYEQMGRVYLAESECGFHPLGQTVPVFLSGEFEGLDQAPVNQAPVNISYLPGHRKEAEVYAEAAQTVRPFVAEWFGPAKGPPEARAEVVELSDPQAAPFETGGMLLTPLTTDAALDRLTAVHQLAHAAFPSPRPWIYEGLAHFAQALYEENERGRQAALDFMGLHRTAVAEAEKAREKSGGGDPLISATVEEFYRSKAMFVWWMLRDMVGDNSLKAALAAYRADADKAPDYVRQLLESQSHRDLGWFFDDWVSHDRGLPDFRVESVYERQAQPGAWIVTVTVENLGNAGAEVPVTLEAEKGDVAQRLEVRARSKATIRLASASPPLKVVVNDGSVPESEMSNNSHEIKAPARAN